VSYIPEGVLGRLATFLRRRLGLLRVVKIYMYVVRVSGIVLPPKEFRKKTSYKRETQIQFELSFEEEPYFRNLNEDRHEAQRRFEAELVGLVKNQENKIEQLPYLNSPFAWSNKVSAEEVSQTTIDNFLKTATTKDIQEYGVKGVIKVPAKPEFIVQAVSFAPVSVETGGADSFEVTEDKIKTFEAIDTFIFKLYRPNEDEEYRSWSGEFLHAL
jgi:hypothetical protein